MKRIITFLAAAVLLLGLAGCGSTGDGGKGLNPSSAVEQVINDQISAANADGGSSAEADADVQPDGGADGSAMLSAAPADYDLTAMNSDMVYATVYRLMVEPDDYVGKTVRMNGLYYAGYYEPTGQYYHYCIIQDALACCAQGLEFVWDDGSHIYPDEYPAEETEIVVQGVFDLYQEEGDEMLYCRLKDAVMQVKGGE